jgi:hypothetical protein
VYLIVDSSCDKTEKYPESVVLEKLDLTADPNAAVIFVSIRAGIHCQFLQALKCRDLKHSIKPVTVLDFSDKADDGKTMPAKTMHLRRFV